MRKGRVDLVARQVAGSRAAPLAAAAVRATRRLRLRWCSGAGPVGAVGSYGPELASGLVPAAGYTR